MVYILAEQETDARICSYHDNVFVGKSEQVHGYEEDILALALSLSVTGWISLPGSDTV